MAYLCPVPVQPRPTGVDWAETLGTWAIVGILTVMLVFDYQRHKRENIQWGPRAD